MPKCENKFLIIIKILFILFNNYFNFKFFKYLIKIDMINEIFYQIK